MNSQWFRLKANAIDLRSKGYSIRVIEKKLGVPRSTLSGWFKSVILSKRQRVKLKQEWQKGLIKARQKAAVWHKAQKEARIAIAEQEAIKVFDSIEVSDSVLECALAMLYLGEGIKGRTGTGIGNSNPRILKFFVKMLLETYKVPVANIKAELHIRADQNSRSERRFWSKQLNLSRKNFTSISVDERTKGSKTYPTYHGVCVIRCGRIDIQRKLLSLSKLLVDKVINRAVSSSG